MDMAVAIFAICILIFINSYFSLAEAAFSNAKRAILQKEADEGDARAARAVEFANDFNQFLPAVPGISVFLAFCIATIAALNLSGPLGEWLFGLGIEWLVLPAFGLAPILITLLVSYFSIVLGIMVPRRIALANAESIAKSLSLTFGFFQAIAAPFVGLATVSAAAISRLFGVNEGDDLIVVSEDEIKDIVADNNELREDEKRMIHEIIDMGDTMAHEIMTPRADMIMVEDTETVRQAIDRMRGTGYSRIPVYHEDNDLIVGIVKYKDLVAPLMDNREDEPVGQFAQEAFFVPETKDILPLLSEMQTNRQQMAIVVDEYGGTDGLITTEDIVEEIVGEIVDETDFEDKYITPLSDNEWLVEGSLPCEDAVEFGWPVEESDDYDTIAGWFLSAISYVPKVGDVYEASGYRFTIDRMRRRRISTIRVKCLEKPHAEVEAEKPDGASGEKGME